MGFSWTEDWYQPSRRIMLPGWRVIRPMSVPTARRIRGLLYTTSCKCGKKGGIAVADRVSTEAGCPTKDKY